MLFDIPTVQQNRGKSWKNPLYRAPESDEWEKIEWNETPDKIPEKIHVCPNKQPGRINT